MISNKFIEICYLDVWLQPLEETLRVDSFQDISCLWTEKLNIFQCLLMSKFIYRFNVISIKNLSMQRT